jgi:hypothetical protein
MTQFTISGTTQAAIALALTRTVVSTGDPHEASWSFMLYAIRNLRITGW